MKPSILFGLAFGLSTEPPRIVTARTKHAPGWPGNFA